MRMQTLALVHVVATGGSTFAAPTELAARLLAKHPAKR